MQDKKNIIIVPEFTIAAASPEGLSYDRYFSKARAGKGEGAWPVGYLEGREMFSREFGKPLYKEGLFVKDSGELEISLPSEYKQFAEAIQKIADYESSHSPLALYKRAMLTIRQDYLEPGGRLDCTEWHQDRIDRDKNAESGPFVDHVYTVSDVFPTLVQEKALHDWFNVLASVTYEKAGLVRQAKPYEINLMTNYCAHHSAYADEARLRTFLRLTYTSPSYETLKALPRDKKEELGLKML